MWKKYITLIVSSTAAVDSRQISPKGQGLNQNFIKWEYSKVYFSRTQISEVVRLIWLKPIKSRNVPKSISYER